ncbi:uncharacterized protein LOC111298689 [Durio zibethinus]|uniref:Uncharacterized protein LOC111298689 n=1 Tax=Durio zibethinus TaxID=66656 RepID=A0A6P5Z9D3_DURZI|nr:uncharacterized protein LOC111298689 [Durio zibethinus]
MGSAAIAKAKILMLREAKRVERPLSKIAGGVDNREIIDKCRRTNNNDLKDSSCWVPHPKTGIYFPKGHEWVMKDVPDDAASLGHTFWLRGVDGVEKPEPDHQLPSDHYFHANM